MGLTVSRYSRYLSSVPGSLAPSYTWAGWRLERTVLVRAELLVRCKCKCGTACVEPEVSFHGRTPVHPTRSMYKQCSRPGSVHCAAVDSTASTPRRLKYATCRIKTASAISGGCDAMHIGAHMHEQELARSAWAAPLTDRLRSRTSAPAAPHTTSGRRTGTQIRGHLPVGSPEDSSCCCEPVCESGDDEGTSRNLGALGPDLTDTNNDSKGRKR